ncbi:pentapeptide repeat-containing protein [Rhodovulum sulfidophilum]|uniref:pentapeptide repeat-containing protein n=1 Tax=Rhodovulum sulfidophilum TaxID=35806 RepID=UPI000952EC24|nr:pentapeptide repeat-containing protein [Rhodovulum sulfidophilum]OLS51180.1 hypothetical protein BV392_03620 [Rhodovulum sulfidophilum]
MGNPQHLDWLLEGVEAWNARREREAFVPDLSGMDIRGAFEKAGKLEEGRIPLAGVNLREADLREANLGGADLGEANLIGAHLREADLWEANLSEADLMDTNLREADLTGADLVMANLRAADLRETDLAGANIAMVNLDDADLRKANLGGADLRGADLREADLWEANLGEADVRTLYLGGGTNVVGTPEYTNLSQTRALTQAQLDTMEGDTGTILPDGLHHPAHWPDPEPPGPHSHGVKRDDSSAAASSSPSIRAKVQERPVAELRHALQASYPEAAVLAEYIAGQIQNEIAAHRMTAIPNDAEALSDYNAKLNFLNETLIAVQRLHEAIPVAEPDQKVTPEEARRIKEILTDIAGKIDLAVRYLDNDTGTYGNFWKIGLIGACSGLFGYFGIPVNLGAPIAAGVIGASTIRLIVEGRRGP